MTPRENTTNATDISITYSDPIMGASLSDLQTGASLICYESWVTDTFSFKIAIVN